MRMRALRGRNKVSFFVLLVLIGLAVPLTQAGAAMVERSTDISRPMPETSTRGAVSDAAAPKAGAQRPGAVFDRGQGPPVSIQFLDAAWSAAVPYATGSHVTFLIPNDPFGLWRTENDTANVGAAPVAYNMRVREDLPMVVSAAAVLVTSVLGWRLVAPPRPQRRRKNRGRNRSSSARRGAHEPTTTRDVLRFITDSVTPRFLKRRKRSRRKASSRYGPTADGSETIGDVARAIVGMVTPQRRRRKRRRGSRQSATR